MKDLLTPPPAPSVAPDRRAEMLADLSERLGVDVKRVEVGDIDFLRDVAEVTVFFRHRAAAEKEAR